MDLNPSFNFESFVVGDSNRSAVAAARAVAEAPGHAYNPLFIYGPSGQGKTHLLMALAQQARRHVPNLSVRYMTLAEFAEAFDTAVEAGQHDAFSRRLGELDMLLVDDVQALTGRSRIQDEVCRLQDGLWQAGKQLVVTSDRPPTELTDIHERLVVRFGGGLVVDIGPPDDVTRLGILRQCAQALEVEFTDGVLEAVALQPVRSVRDLLGGLARLVALDAAYTEPVTPSDAQAVFDGEDILVASRGPSSPGPELGGPKTTGEFEDFMQLIRVRIAEAARQWRSQPRRGPIETIPSSIRDREKMIWTWPEADERLIEELS